MNDDFNIDYAVVSAFERSKAIQDKPGSGRLFTIVLMAVFFIVLMVGLAASASIYHGVALSQDRTNDLHMESGLLSNTIRINDAADAVALGTGPEGEALVLIERLDSGTYETRIYKYQGSIVQEYAIAGRGYNPENAIKLVESDVFEFSYSKGLLSVMTDQGMFSVALRSSQEKVGAVESKGAARLARAYEVSAEQAAGGGAR